MQFAALCVEARCCADVMFTPVWPTVTAFVEKEFGLSEQRLPVEWNSTLTYASAHRTL